MLLRALLRLRPPICREGGLASRPRGGDCRWICGRPSLVATAPSSAAASPPFVEPLSAAAFVPVPARRKQQRPPPASSLLHTAAGGGQSRSSPALWADVTSVRHGPAPALLLGLAGLAPFALAPACMLASGCYDGQLVAAQTVYGATVLAFLGGVRWGAALPDGSPVKPGWFNLTTSVMPPLLAWAALLLPQPWPLPAVLCSLLGVLYADLQLPDYPAWFRGLRLLLSVAAVASLALSIICWLALPSEKDRGSSTAPPLAAVVAPEVVAVQQGASDAFPKGV